MTDDDPVEGAIAVTDAFLDTFNAGDVTAHAATLAYPHVRLASGRLRLWHDATEAASAMEQGMAALRDQVGWHHSEWDHRRVIHAGPVKVHLDVQFTRYREDGSVIGAYPAVYVVARKGDHWLVAARSSFAP